MRTNALCLLFALSLLSAGCVDDKTSVPPESDSGSALPDAGGGGGGTDAGGGCTACDVGEECVDGECQSPPTCDETTCGGCCDGDTCVETPDDAQCGTGGAECTTCTAPATCEAGVCMNPCDATTCGGCCGADGCVALDEQSDAECGRGGAACGGCGSTEECIDGACVDTSCSSSCAGCCIGSTCVDPVSASSCGADGSPCMGCGTDAVCEDGMCMPDLSTTWDIIAVSGVIPERTPEGDNWDAFGGLPDAAVRLTAGASGDEVTGTTSSQPNTTEPAWNEPVLEDVTAQQLVDGATLTVLDADTFGFQDVGTCTLGYTPSHFPSVTRWRCAADPEGPGYAGWEVVLRVERAD